MTKYFEMIDNREPVIFDGALGTEIQKFEPTDGDFAGYSGCNEYLNISRPDIIESIHVKYLEAGANAIETNTFGGSRTKLGEFGLESRVHEINKAAAQIARRAIEKVGGDDKPRFVCGSIGPTGFLPSSGDSELSSVNFDQLVDIYTEQVSGLVDGGADILLIETSQDLLEVRAVILAVHRLLSSSHPKRIPLQAQVTMDAGGKMLLGSDVSAFLGAVQGMGVDVVGLNCSSGPIEMGPCIDELLKLSTLPVSMLPNAGLPMNVDGKAVYKMGPNDFADKMLPFVKDKGVSVVGGCCGTTPEHIRALAEAVNGKKVAKRDTTNRSCFLSTGISGLDLERARRPIIIGERLNTQGSKKTKEYVIGRNFEELYYIAKEQIDKKSTLLDLCVAANELDVGEAEMMGSVVAYLRERVGIPFCIDTTEPAVMETALKKSPGSVLINSINLEHGGAKARKILPLAVDFGCPVVALTIDDAGMAATVDRKLEVASRLIKLACDEYRLPEHYIYIDPLVFTLATGDVDTANAALETLEALRRIKKEFPNVRTAMGVSNVSFGLKPKARRIMNNLMLHHAVEAGLTAAIFNPLHVDDINKYDKTVRGLGEDLLFNRHPDSLQKFVEYFEAEVDGQRTAHSAQRAAGCDQGGGADANVADMPPEKRLRSAIIDRDKRHLPEIINKLLENRPAPDILNTILLPAMSEVGELMAAGEMILPFVLQAAEAMREAVAILEPHLKASGGGAVKGKIVIATVYGDVHDIGKNLVASILRNQGFDVIDLGKQVAIDTIVEAVRREKPDAVGLSALLVTTSKQMGECVKTFAQLGINTPIIIGGAAVNREFAVKIAVLEDGSDFAPGVHYAKDAFDVVKIFDGMDVGGGGGSIGKGGISTEGIDRDGISGDGINININKDGVGEDGINIGRDGIDKGGISEDGINIGKDGIDRDGIDKNGISTDKGSSGKIVIGDDDTLAPSTQSSSTNPTRKTISHDYLVEPPFHGTGEILVWDTPALLAAVDREQLFKTRWGGGNLDAGAYASARQEEFGPVFERLSSEIINDSLLEARGFYGFFPAIADNERVSFLDPSDYRTERLEFLFPRTKRGAMSLADYVRPEGDTVSTQAVTIGSRIGERCRELLVEHDRYSDGYYLNGLANYLVEAVADKLSAEIRRALGLPKGVGRRYSFGYYGMPSLEEQARLLAFLAVEERLGISLTPGFQMQPEHSTVAIFIHHRDAEYLS